MVADVCILCSGVKSPCRPARSPEEEGRGFGGGEGGGADLQRGDTQQQGVASLQVYLRLLHGSAACLQQLHWEGEMRLAIVNHLEHKSSKMKHRQKKTKWHNVHKFQ